MELSPVADPAACEPAFLGECAQSPRGAAGSAIAGNDGNICYPKLGRDGFI